MTYEDYIASAAWRALRAAAIERDGGRCRFCDSPDDLEVHHRRYPPRGAWHLDTLDALTTCCAACHEAITSAQRATRYAAVTLSAGATEARTPATEILRERLPDLDVPAAGYRPAPDALLAPRRPAFPGSPGLG